MTPRRDSELRKGKRRSWLRGVKTSLGGSLQLVPFTFLTHNTLLTNAQCYATTHLKESLGELVDLFSSSTGSWNSRDFAKVLHGVCQAYTDTGLECTGDRGRDCWRGKS